MEIMQDPEIIAARKAIDALNEKLARAAGLEAITLQSKIKECEAQLVKLVLKKKFPDDPDLGK
jgi:hypothetical protein